MSKKFDVLDLRRFEDEFAIRNAVIETLKRDGYINSHYLLRGCDATRIGEVLPQKSVSLNIFSNASEWYFANHLSFKKSISDINSPLFHAFHSQKPLLVVFDSSFFGLNSNLEHYLKENISPYSALAKAYMLQTRKN